MNITSGTSEKYSYYDWYKTHSYYKDVGKELSQSMIRNLLKYAFERLDHDIIEMIKAKNWKCHIDRLCDDDNETLNESTYQVNFINERGLRISVNGIFIRNYKPHLDHGLSMDENQ